LKEIKDVIGSALETHIASVHDDITDSRSDMNTQFAKAETKYTAVEGRIDRLESKIDHIDEKLGGFENREVDKRLQLEVRVARLEKQRS
jgi:predicted  nucleic acid-binding Zn-ribbon protein